MEEDQDKSEVRSTAQKTPAKDSDSESVEKRALVKDIILK